MENNEDQKTNKNNNIIIREYLHSVSRIGDRLKMLRRDINKQKKELEYMEEDVQLLADAFDTIFTDLMEKIGTNFDKNQEHDVEEL